MRITLSTAARRIGSDLLQLVAPSICPGCHSLLPAVGSSLCASCLDSIEAAPYPEEIYDAMLSSNPEATDVLDAIGARFLFEEVSAIRPVLHALKYAGAAGLGFDLGRETGETLGLFPEFRDVDLIVPIPLHPARERERGYNQAAVIGDGLGEAFGVRSARSLLRRTRNNPSQTKQGMRARLQNVRGLFAVDRTESDTISGAHVLLCDDVVTTGATLAVAATALAPYRPSRISAATVAFDALRTAG